MIIVALSFWQRLKLLFGWYVQIELHPNTAQSYSQFVLPPWEEQRNFHRAVHVTEMLDALGDCELSIRSWFHQDTERHWEQLRNAADRAEAVVKKYRGAEKAKHER